MLLNQNEQNMFNLQMNYTMKEVIMKNDAIAIANYFVDKANKDTHAPYPLTLLRLVKYVYIAYGFSMAILDKIIIDKRFDIVEAWKYGPVIPSVYHSFKHNQNNPITENSSILTSEEDDGTLVFSSPCIKDKDISMILDFVWDRYKDRTTTELINILHKKGTPWDYCYKEGINAEIPDEMTKVYYKSIIDNALKG